jgi:molecular chaperone DnaJ
MSTSRDLYEVLGVDRSADKAALKKAYRKLAMQYHPDRNPGDKEAEKKFKEISHAYDILKDDQKKAAYDRFGHSAFEGGGPGAGSDGGFGAGFAGGGAGFGGFSDIFDEMFGEFMGGSRGGASSRSSANRRGADLRYDLEITLEEAFEGIQKKVSLGSYSTCGTCDGTGAAKGTSVKTCSGCHGRGKVRSQQGFFTVERTCPQCQGMGESIEKPCSDCRGMGRITKDRQLSVSIPAGVEDGTRIRLSGEGEVGIRKGPAGDLYVFLTIKPHKFFKREGHDLHCEVPVPMVQASLGGHVDVPTIEGAQVKVTLPEGTQSGKILRLKDKGMSIMRKPSRGALYVHINVETPVNLSKTQRKLLEQFEEASPNKGNSPSSMSFLGKLKDFLGGK